MSESPGLESRVSGWSTGARSRRGGGDPFPRATLVDLVRRALRPSDDLARDPAEVAWVRSVLTEPELAIWSAQSGYDRAHSIRAARRVERQLEGTPWRGDPRWPAAALMHDVGKQDAALSFLERVTVNLLRRAIGKDRALRWSRRAAGSRRRAGAYLAHGEIGAAMIRDAGGREEVAVWAEVHQTHAGGAAAGVPAAVVAALLAADRA